MDKKEPDSAYMRRIIANNILPNLKEKYNINQLIDILKGIKKINVLVMGDTIIDEYAYSETLDRAKKEPVLVFRYLNSNFFAGGILAIANHLAEFCENVTLATCIGKDNTTKRLIGQKLNKKIKTNFFFDKERPTLIKKRYIEKYWNRKIFEVYNREANMPAYLKEDILKFLNENIQNFDAVIVGDFGHGMINDEIKKIIVEKSKYLSINVQTNSGNLGFNLITKVPRADFISLTLEELQLAVHDKTENIYKLVEELNKRIDCKKICVTLGKGGILYFDNNSHYYCPVFSTEVIDTIGAGDAVFSITSLIAYKNKDPMLIPFLGNCIGALAVKIMGNERPVKFEELSEFLTNTIK